MNNTLLCFDLFDTLVQSGGVSGQNYQNTFLNIAAERGFNSAQIQPALYPFVRDTLMVGAYTYEEMAQRLCMRFGFIPSAAEVNQIAQQWKVDNKKIEWAPEAETTLRSLRSAFQESLVLVSNVTAPGWEAVNERLGIERNFSRTFLSCFQGVAKPEQRVWNDIEGWYPQASQKVMIGNDEFDDLAVPRRLGWTTGLISPGKKLVDTVSGCLQVDPKKMRDKYLILDIEVGEQEVARLNGLGFSTLDCGEMSRDLMNWSGWSDLDPKKTLLMYPGQGGRLLRSYLDEDWLEQFPFQTEVDIQRWWSPGSDPMFSGGEIYPRRMMTNIRDTVLLDDAVSSGGTAQRILERSGPWLPNSNFQMVTWVTQRSPRIKGFKRFYATRTVGEVNKKAPLNSLSTLVKDRSLAAVYLERNFMNPEVIGEFFETLR